MAENKSRELKATPATALSSLLEKVATSTVVSMSLINPSSDMKIELNFLNPSAFNKFIYMPCGPLDMI